MFRAVTWGFEPARGLEPLTFRLQVGCATNCATPARRRLIVVRTAVASRQGLGLRRYPRPMGSAAKAGQAAIVVGAGPGIGMAVARRFGQAGYRPALLARSEEKLEHLGKQLQQEGYATGWRAIDITDEVALRDAVARFGEHSGSIGHLHYNPSAFRSSDALSLSADELLADVRLGAASLLTAVQAALPFMPAGARVTATGGATADRPWQKAASLGVQKAALRNLVSALDSALSGRDIRAMSLTVAGTVQEGTPFDPAFIADALYEVSQTESEFWASEIRFTGRE